MKDPEEYPEEFQDDRDVKRIRPDADPEIIVAASCPDCGQRLEIFVHDLF